MRNARPMTNSRNRERTEREESLRGREGGRERKREEEKKYGEY